MSLVSVLGLGCLYQTAVRGAVRRKYGIEGSCCADCCTSMFCGTCTTIQMTNELVGRNAPKLDQKVVHMQNSPPYQVPMAQS
ncbi:MAG: hypothetical protein WDW36_006557 [Sanguina aurantia]